MRLYRYVGPAHLAEQAQSQIPRCQPGSPEELTAWLTGEGYALPVTLTYVVTADGRLRVSDRNSEHVACARGEPVRAAGEIGFRSSAGRPVVDFLTNQSTGYCPEPSCFAAASDAVLEAGFDAPPGFSHEFTFRRCPTCSGISIVKEADFECAACGSALPLGWNFDDPARAAAV
jgi:hypothetical protein